MDLITVVIESPKGSGNKYDYDTNLKAFKLNKVLPVGMVFPFDFGFMPGTKGEDGDPLDVIVISEISSFTGCYMDCRLIGAIKVKQTERNGDTMRNDRYFAIPEVSHLFKEVNSIVQLPEGMMTELECFFKNYNEQAGKKFEVLERVNADEAYQMIKK